MVEQPSSSAGTYSLCKVSPDCFVARMRFLAYSSNPDLPTSIAACPLSTGGLAATPPGVGAHTS